MQISQNALTVLRKRRYIRGNETPEGMCRRVAHTVANDDAELEEQIYNVMTRQEFCFNSPTLMNAGRELQQLSACFVLPIEDSMESIFETLKNSALIHKSGGGTGFNFSHLRPKNDQVRSTGGVASGPVSFLRVFNAATEAVKQGGTRRGANMAILSIHHPDILEFITCKRDNADITNFNISVGVTDRFVGALKKGGEYELINPRTNQPVKHLPAREVFDLIVDMAWRNGEPGIIFLDRLEGDNPTPALGTIESTNPCWAGDTPVWTKDGPRRIDSLVGTEIPVLTLTGRGELCFRRMYDIRQTSQSAGAVCVHLGDGTVLRCTPNHQLYLRNGLKVEARQLKAGDKLAGHARPEQVARVEMSAERIPVYNATVEETHRYFVVTRQGGILSANCGEQPLLPYESCNLGSINLARLVKDSQQIDWDRLCHLVRLAVRALDNVIDANKYPLDIIEERTKLTRKIGLGVMGWAEMLIQLGIPYDTEEAVGLARQVMKFIRDEARKESARLAEERGPFPAYEGSALQLAGGPPRRNASLTTIAPTGTISIIMGASSGIEPLFAVAYTRHVLDGERLVEVNPLFEEVTKKEGFFTKELINEVAERGSLRDVDSIPEKVKRVFVTALDIAPEWHVRMQAAFQEYTDAAVSKTINLPHEATREDVASAYRLAYELGCKGLTVYRVGSRDEQVLNVGRKAEETAGKGAAPAPEVVAGASETQSPPDPGSSNEAGKGIGEKAAGSAVQAGRAVRPAGVRLPGGGCGEWGNIRPVSRPQRLMGLSDKKETPLGNLFLTLNVLDGHPFELFAQIGKAGSDVTAFTEAIARLISLAFRCGVSPEEVADQLIGIGGSRSVGYGRNRVRSVPDAIGRFIWEYIAAVGEEEPPRASEPTSAEAGKGMFNLCPSCGMQAFVHVEGCSKCTACGYSEC
ncbi:MAG: adenosylcobalamin-dependent ribonucleoside-diphosphate reductase [Pigmentiphaga sp.]